MQCKFMKPTTLNVKIWYKYATFPLNWIVSTSMFKLLNPLTNKITRDAWYVA